MGDNDLEELFGIMRMKGGHNSAMNYSQALDQIGAAKDVDIVFKKHPELNAGSRRLKLTTVEGLDHIRPDLWRGDIITSHCDLPSAWIAGHNKAITALIDARMPADSVAFDGLFSLPGYDLMRPWGSNKYMGVTSDVESTSNVLQLHTSALPSSSSVISSEEDIQLEEDVLTLEEALIHQLPSGVAHIDSGSCIDLESSLSGMSSQQVPLLVTESGIHPDDYLLVDRKYIHKETICRRILNKYFIPKSLNHQERVYSVGFTKVNRRSELAGRSITGGNTFIIGDVFLTIVHCNSTLTIALVHSTLIEHHSTTCHEIAIPDLCTPNVKLAGQILTLVPTRQPLAEQRQWLWSGNYVKTSSDIMGISKTTEKIIEVTVPGLLVQLVNPDTTCVCFCDDVDSDDFCALNNIGNTWAIGESALALTCDTLWSKACEHDIALKVILQVPSPCTPSDFPYLLPNGLFMI